MKLFLVLTAFIFSLSAFAISEVECTGRNDGANIRVEVYGRYNQGYYKDATVWVSKDGTSTSTRYAVYFRAPWGGLSRAEYEGAGLRLEVDFWPDSIPRWGRSYFGTVWIGALNNSAIMVNCRYPSI